MSGPSSFSDNWTLVVCPGIQLRALTVDTDILTDAASPAAAHSIRVLVSGEVRCIFENDCEIGISSPSLCVNCPARGPRQIHLLGRNKRLRAVVIDVTPDLTSEDYVKQISEEIEAFNYIANSSFFYCPAQDTIAAIATQILTCPLQGTARSMYLSGLALQLLAMATRTIGPYIGKQKINNGLSPASLALVDYIKCVLRDSSERTPTLAELARQVGVGPKRLAVLFRQECGLRISDFLQQSRLERAYFLLTHTNLQVAEIAHRVGYTPAYFSTAFRKRYGQQPRELRSGGG